MTSLRTAVVALSAAFLAAGGALAQSSSTEKGASDARPLSATAPEKSAADESPLVKAARDGAANRTKKSRLSIEDKDVKKSKGKLIETTTKPLAPIPAAADVETRMRSEAAAADALKNRDKVIADHVATKKKEVEDLESELRRIEETYYDEDDPDFREEVIEKRFDETRSRLEKARQDLEAARVAAAERGVSTP
ncbi:MAG: hypothetical protein ACSLFQ_20015 [Thermoanaerobaculia bacterium]